MAGVGGKVVGFRWEEAEGYGAGGRVEGLFGVLFD